MSDDEPAETTAGTEPDDDGRRLTPERRSQLRRVAHVAGVLLLLAIVLPFVLYAVPQIIGAEHSYVVLSGSMQPAFGPGDVMFVDEVSAGSIEEGDIVNFQREQDARTTTHRVIEVTEQDGQRAFVTQGDNNEDPDQGVVTPAELRGRTMTLGGYPIAIPLVGYLIQFTGTQTGFALLFVIPVSLLVVNEIYNVIASARADGEETATPDGGASPVETSDGATAADGGDGGDAGEGDESGDGISFHPGELRLAMVVLAAFVAYSGWVAYGDPNALTIGVTGSAAVALALVGGLYAVGSTTAGESEGESAAAAGPGLHISEAPLPTETDEPHESVSSLEAMVDLAESTDGDLSRDPADETYHLSVGSTLYVYQAGEAADEEMPDGGRANALFDGPAAGGTPQLTDEPERTGPAPDRDSTTEADDD